MFSTAHQAAWGGCIQLEFYCLLLMRFLYNDEPCEVQESSLHYD